MAEGPHGADANASPIGSSGLPHRQPQSASRHDDFLRNLAFVAQNYALSSTIRADYGQICSSDGLTPVLPFASAKSEDVR
jgi:hypothetical protein